jgi:predicted phosphodiesterase
MRYGIFSDIHSNLEALEAVIQAYKKEAIDAYLCVGDVIGYAANPKECIDKIEAIAMITIAGNHDCASIDLFSVEYFNPVAKEAISWTKRSLREDDRDFLGTLKLVYQNEDLTLVHGTLGNPSEFYYMIDSYAARETFELLRTDVCFVGHSHVAGVFIKDKDNRLCYRQDSRIDILEGNKYILNVGSVGQPRDGNPKAAYCIYDTEKKEIQIKRTAYDIQASREKIIDAGLHRSLADRLILGR